MSFCGDGDDFSTLHYQIVLLLTWFLSSFIAFAAYKILVFNTVGNHVREYLKSIMIWSLSYLLNAGILEVLAGWLALNVYLAQAAAIAVIMVINYVLFKYFAFKQPKPQTRWEKYWIFQCIQLIKKALKRGLLRYRSVYVKLLWL